MFTLQMEVALDKVSIIVYVRQSQTRLVESVYNDFTMRDLMIIIAVNIPKSL